MGEFYKSVNVTAIRNRLGLSAVELLKQLLKQNRIISMVPKMVPKMVPLLSQIEYDQVLFRTKFVTKNFLVLKHIKESSKIV